MRDRSGPAAIQVEAVAAGRGRPIGIDQVDRAADGPAVQARTYGFETTAEAAGGLEAAVVNQLDRGVRRRAEQNKRRDGGEGFDSGLFAPLL